MTIDVNGATCLVNTSGDPAFQKPNHRRALGRARGGGGNGYTGAVPLPATMEVDYVKVWR